MIQKLSSTKRKICLFPFFFVRKILSFARFQCKISFWIKLLWYVSFYHDVISSAETLVLRPWSFFDLLCFSSSSLLWHCVQSIPILHRNLFICLFWLPKWHNLQMQMCRSFLTSPLLWTKRMCWRKYITRWNTVTWTISRLCRSWSAWLSLLKTTVPENELLLLWRVTCTSHLLVFNISHL